MKKEQKTALNNVAGAGAADKVEGNAKNSGGRVKEAVGALTGDDTLRNEGLKDQTKGKIQHKLGDVKEGAEHLLDKAKESLRGH